MKRWFQRVVLSRRWLTFIVMGLSFCVSGVATLNLFYLLRANTALLLHYGWQALMDGAARQLLELLLNGYFATAAYLVFKACESRLVAWLVSPEPPPDSVFKRNLS
jgi:hypothetical protein